MWFKGSMSTQVISSIKRFLAGIVKGLISSQMVWNRQDFRQRLPIYKINGITGDISFDFQGEVEKDPILLSITGRKFHSLQESKNEYTN